MKTKTPKTKKLTPLERIATALESIAFHLNNPVNSIESIIPINTQLSKKEDYITFPEKTAKEIIEECSNKVGDGKLIHNTEWYKNEDFLNKEKCRPRTIKIPTEIEHMGKSWDEVNKLGELFNFAEIVYMLRESDSFRKLLAYPNENKAWWTWTNSRDSDGDLLYVGIFGSNGSSVNSWRPRDSDSYLGVCFSRSE